jgi:tyrosyl-tRNA synthetase
MASQEETYELITRNLQEVLGADIIKSILAEGRAVKCYWGESFISVPSTHKITWNLSIVL